MMRRAGFRRRVILKEEVQYYMGRPFKLGLIQVASDYKTKTKEKQIHMLELGEKCLQEGAELVFFPEAYLSMSPDWDDEMMKKGELLRKTADEFKEKCAELAVKYHSYVVPWDYEVTEDGKIFNTSYILDRQGIEIGRYRKVHPTDGEVCSGVTPGDSFHVFDLDIGKVGIMICFDNYWPESARCLSLLGAELILYPLIGDTLTPQWEMRLKARAVDNFVYVASCQAQERYNIAYTGLVNPHGDVIARLDCGPSYRVVEVDMGRQVITSTRGRPNVINEDLKRLLDRCRNSNAYGPIIKGPKELWPWEKVYLGKPPENEHH